MIRTGVVLPTFRDTPDAAFAAAAEAVDAGIDGLFCYDHIWPLGHGDFRQLRRRRRWRRDIGDRSPQLNFLDLIEFQVHE